MRAGTGADVFKAALYFASASRGAADTVYNSTGEVTNTSGTGYTAAGLAFTWVAPTSTGTTAFSSPSASLVWSALTVTTAFDAVLLYNVTQGDKSVVLLTFGSQTITAGTLTLSIPTNDASTAILRLT